MSFFAVLFALMIEQLKPLPRHNWVHDTLVCWVGWTGRKFGSGRERHAAVVWCIAVLTPSLAAAMQQRQRWQGKRIGVTLCGGNVDRDVFAGVLSCTAPGRPKQAAVPSGDRPMYSSDEGRT